MSPLLKDLALTALSLYNLSSALIRLGALLVIPSRHEPAAATAWLLLVLIWPWPGALAYGVLGSRLLPEGRLKMHRRHAETVRRFRANLPTDDRPDPVPETAKPTADLAFSLTEQPAQGGHRVSVLTDSPTFFKTLLQNIEEAKEDIKLLYYIVDDQGPCVEVMQALGRAARRGVSCHVMADSVGASRWFSRGGADGLRKTGVRVTELLPVRLFRRSAARYDLRNHRKIALFDHTKALTGSHNLISPNYNRKNVTWHDLSLALEGPAVAQLEWLFLEDAYAETGEWFDSSALLNDAPRVGDDVVQSLPSGPSYKTENFLLVVLSALTSARRQITITTPYLVPASGLMEGLAVARGRGVEIRLLVPAKSDQWLIDLAGKAYFQDLLDLGVKIYQYHGGVLHAKTITVDEHLAFVGSNNFDTRSFALNFELSLGLYSPDAVSAVRLAQKNYISRCSVLTPEEWRKRSRPARWLSGLTKLISPLL